MRRLTLNEASLDFDSLADNFHGDLFTGPVLDIFQHHTREFGVQSFVSGNQIVRVCQTRHFASSFEPINDAETGLEEYALDACEGN